MIFYITCKLENNLAVIFIYIYKINIQNKIFYHFEFLNNKENPSFINFSISLHKLEEIIKIIKNKRFIYLVKDTKLIK